MAIRGESLNSEVCGVSDGALGLYHAVGSSLGMEIYFPTAVGKGFYVTRLMPKLAQGKSAFARPGCSGPSLPGPIPPFVGEHN